MTLITMVSIIPIKMLTLWKAQDPGQFQKSKIWVDDAISAACRDQKSKVTYLKLPQLNFETDRSSLECGWPIQAKLVVLVLLTSRDGKFLVKKIPATFLHTQIEFFDKIFFKPTLLIEICRLRRYLDDIGSKMVSKSPHKHTDPVSKPSKKNQIFEQN